MWDYWDFHIIRWKDKKCKVIWVHNVWIVAWFEDATAIKFSSKNMWTIERQVYYCVLPHLQIDHERAMLWKNVEKTQGNYICRIKFRNALIKCFFLQPVMPQLMISVLRNLIWFFLKLSLSIITNVLLIYSIFM